METISGYFNSDFLYLLLVSGVKFSRGVSCSWGENHNLSITCQHVTPGLVEAHLVVAGEDIDGSQRKAEVKDTWLDSP